MSCKPYQGAQGKVGGAQSIRALAASFLVVFAYVEPDSRRPALHFMLKSRPCGTASQSVFAVTAATEQGITCLRRATSVI
eukprot:g78190.t1